MSIIANEVATVEIKGAQYEVEMAGDTTVTLTKLVNGESYEVARTDNVVTCTCLDYLNRHQGHGTTCKHGSAMLASGMLEPVAVAGGSPVAEMVDARETPEARVRRSIRDKERRAVAAGKASRLADKPSQETPAPISGGSPVAEMATVEATPETLASKEEDCPCWTDPAHKVAGTYCRTCRVEMAGYPIPDDQPLPSDLVPLSGRCNPLAGRPAPKPATDLPAKFAVEAKAIVEAIIEARDVPSRDERIDGLADLLHVFLEGPIDHAREWPTMWANGIQSGPWFRMTEFYRDSFSRFFALMGFDREWHEADDEEEPESWRFARFIDHCVAGSPVSFPVPPLPEPDRQAMQAVLDAIKPRTTPMPLTSDQIHAYAAFGLMPVSGGSDEADTGDFPPPPRPRPTEMIAADLDLMADQLEAPHTAKDDPTPEVAILLYEAADEIRRLSAEIAEQAKNLRYWIALADGEIEVSDVADAIDKALA